MLLGVQGPGISFAAGWLALAGIAPHSAMPQDAAAKSGAASISAPASTGQSPSARLSQAEQSWCALVDPARAQIRVRELVALGARMGGTASGERSAEYLQQRFAEAGLAVERILDPEIWCHEETGWSVRARTPAEPWIALERAWPFGFSPTSAGRARLGAEPRAGAALLSDTRPKHPLSPEPSVALVDGLVTSDGNWPLVQSWSKTRAPRWPCFGLSRPEGARLRAWLSQGLEVEVEWELTTHIAREQPITIQATLPGRKSAQGWPSPYFLLCAHGDSDSGGPGANDNASGVAILLEIAHAWSKARALGWVEELDCDLRFVVWGTEIHSSGHYLKRCYEQPELVLGLVNFDQSGFGSGADQLHMEPDDLTPNRALLATMLTVLAGGAITAADPTQGGLEHPAPPSFPAGEPAAAIAHDTPMGDDFPRHWSTNKSLGGTDSYVFSGSSLFQERGLPAVTVFASAWGRAAEHPRTSGMQGESWRERGQVSVDYDVHYHSAGDTPENTTDLEPWNMAWCARVAMLGTWRYLRERER